MENYGIQIEKLTEEIAILKAERDDANACALKKMNANHALQDRLAIAESDKCALAADALNARAVIRMLVACVQTPQRVSPDFPKYAVRRANELVESELISANAVARIKGDIAKENEALKAALAETNVLLACEPMAWSQAKTDQMRRNNELLNLAPALDPERAAGVALKPCEHDGARSTTD
jgi:hypothetical protein